MAFQPSWYDAEETVLLIEVTGEPVWDEFYAMTDTIIEYVQAAPGRLDIITHIKGKRMPPGNPVPHMQANARQMQQFEPKGIIAIVNNTPSRSFIEALFRVVGTSLRMQQPKPGMGGMVSSLEAALELIRKDRMRLNLPMPTPRIPAPAESS